MHVGIFADIEGSFGIWRMRQCRMGTSEWQYGRECLTKDVNCVIQGAFDGGAQQVTVIVPAGEIKQYANWMAYCF
jgi:D-amino peptidase